MKKTVLFLATFLISTVTLLAQSGINYQAVIRDNSNAVLESGTVNLTFTIFDTSNPSIWSGVENGVAINNGVVNAVIGNINNAAFMNIDWSQPDLQLTVDVSGDATMTSTQDLQYVPYALYSETALNVINDEVDDDDNVVGNEFQTLSLSGQTLTLSDGGGSVTITDNDDQDLSLNNGQLGITNGNGVSLPWFDNGSIVRQTDTSKPVSIGTDQSATGTDVDLMVNGFTKLGSDNAPGIKTEYFEQAISGQNGTEIELGINASEILSLSVLVDVGNQLIPPVSGNYDSSVSTTHWAGGHGRNYGYQYQVSGSTLTITTDLPSTPPETDLNGEIAKVFVIYRSN